LAIALRASIIAKYSAVYNDAVGGRLLENEMWNSRMKKEKPANKGEPENEKRE